MQQRNPFNDSTLYAVETSEAVQEFRQSKAAASWVGLVATALTLVVLSMSTFIELSAFGFLLAKAVLALSIFTIVDKYIFHRLDTYEELREGNVAVGLYVCGLCLLLAAAVISS